VSVIERNDLLRYAKLPVEGAKLGIRNKKTPKKVDLLEMSDSEKIKLIKAVKESLRQKVVEAKLWQSFVETEKLTVNGQTINCEGVDLKGFSINELMKIV
jgi:hypothetical protein